MIANMQLFIFLNSQMHKWNKESFKKYKWEAYTENLAVCSKDARH